MPAPQLPQTGVRLSTATSFYAVRESAVGSTSILGSFTSQGSLAGQDQKALNQMVPILAITKLTENQSRTTSDRYETDSDIPGLSLEVLQMPTSRTLSLDRMVLYTSDLIGALGYTDALAPVAGVSDGSLLSQQDSPFILIRLDTVPQGSTGSTATLYRGCLFQSIDRTYNLGSGDIAVVDSASIRYAGRQVIPI